jgi:hypothetical protein
MVAGALVVVVVGVVLAVVQPFASRSSALSFPLARAALVDLPGNSTRFDDADIDPAAHRLALAHLGDDALLILDTRTNSVVATVPDVAHATGVIIVPSLHRVFASAPGSGEVLMIDEESGAVLARAPAGRYPDGLTYVPSTGQVSVSDQSGGVETVIDAGTGRRVATVDLGGDAGTFATSRPVTGCWWPCRPGTRSPSSIRTPGPSSDASPSPAATTTTDCSWQAGARSSRVTATAC